MKKIVSLVALAATSILGLASCAKDDFKPLADDVTKITIGATPSPHTEILEFAKPLYKAKGYDLEIKTFNDYIIPNTSVQSGELDANYFQHITYQNDFNKKNKTDLVSVGNVHYEPYGLYAGTKTSLDDIKSGDKILVPNDTTNEARALLLLQQIGLIKLKNGVGINATKLDIIENKHNLNIIELEAAQIPNSRTDGAYAVINGNYAIGAGLKVTDALAVESSTGDAATAYANILTVRNGNHNHKAIKALYEVLTSAEVREYIATEYKGAVVAL